MKGPEATPMKDVDRQEPIDKTNDGVEPLIAVTSHGKQPYKNYLNLFSNPKNARIRF